MAGRAIGIAPASEQLNRNGQRASTQLLLPLKPKPVRFAMIRDGGTGEKQHYEGGQQMAIYHDKVFDFVITLGDNI